jgi:hypothetical protein
MKTSWVKGRRSSRRPPPLHPLMIKMYCRKGRRREKQNFSR